MGSRSKKKLALQGGVIARQTAEAKVAKLQAQQGFAVQRQAEAEIKIADLTGRADGLLLVPEWKKAQLARKQAVTRRLMKNGITPQDLTDEYERGRKDATKEYLDRLVPYQQKFFYSAAAIASHELFGFGETRIIRLLDRIQQIMVEEISTGDIIERANRETGVDIFDEDYTI